MDYDSPLHDLGLDEQAQALAPNTRKADRGALGPGLDAHDTSTPFDLVQTA